MAIDLIGGNTANSIAGNGSVLTAVGAQLAMRGFYQISVTPAP